MRREGIYMKKRKISKKKSAKKFQNRLNGSKVTIFFLPCTKKKFKNDQDVCWLEHDYMEMKIWLSESSSIIISTWPLKLAHCAPPPPPANVDYVLFTIPIMTYIMKGGENMFGGLSKVKKMWTLDFAWHPPPPCGFNPSKWIEWYTDVWYVFKNKERIKTYMLKTYILKED